MVDMHCDLLTIAYLCYLKNDYSKLKKLASCFNDNNVKAVMMNLYFMSDEEMFDKFGKDYWTDKSSVLEMFKISTNLVKKFFPKVEAVFCIEGCDYINEVEEVELLYDYGLRAITLVWNNESKYGSGNRSKKGLTPEGEKLLHRAIELGIGIDLSHANEKTFSDMIYFIKEEKQKGYDVICYASHSNVKELCDVDRNLSDEQIKMIKDVAGLVGAVSYIKFVSLEENINSSLKADKYLEHIDYLVRKLGIDSVMISSDDMTFLDEFEGTNIFDYKDINSSIRKLLAKKYSDIEIEKLMFNNAKNRIIKKLI